MRKTILPLLIAALGGGGLATAAPTELDVREPTAIFLRTDGSVRPDVLLDQVRRAGDPGIRAVLDRSKFTRGAAGIDDATLDRLLANERNRTGRIAPDPRFDLYLTIPANVKPAKMIAQFAATDGVLMVGEAPRPVAPPSPTAAGTADYEPSQRYLNPRSTGGIGARTAWDLGLDGTGVSMCDIEYDFDGAHCDLPPITILGGVPNSPYGNSHGTAVFGEMISLDDGVGTTGIAFGADDIYFAPTYIGSTYDIGAAVYRATAAMPAGSVIVLEVQIRGPNYVDNSSQAGLVPMEWWPPYYDAVVNAIANGMIVVQAAGNGEEDLDDPVYAIDNFGHHPFLAENDSGSIIVGAGAAWPSCWGYTARTKLSFSNYGSRVNVQGYGNCVATTGYGDLDGTDSCDYTGGFSGTSSATPIVAGACMLLQEFARDTLGRSLECAELREILISTGNPQTRPADGQIGPLPDVIAALDAIDPPPPPCTADFTGDGRVDGADLGVLMTWFGSTGFAGDLDDDGDIDGADLGAFLIQWGPCPE